MCESSRFRGILPANVITFGSEIAASIDHLYLDQREFECVRNAVPQRQREFLTGRKLAREALRSFAIYDFPLQSNPDRSPAWPVSVVGSITHSSSYCAVAVASAGQYRGIGIDAQEIIPVKPELWKSFCTHLDLEQIKREHPSSRQALASLIFSAKESYFKAHFPANKMWIDFMDVSVRKTDDYFEITSVTDTKIPGKSIFGKYIIDSHTVFTAIVL